MGQYTADTGVLMGGTYLAIEGIGALTTLPEIPASIVGAVLAAVLRVGLDVMYTWLKEYKAEAELRMKKTELEKAKLEEELEDLTDEQPPPTR